MLKEARAAFGRPCGGPLARIAPPWGAAQRPNWPMRPQAWGTPMSAQTILYIEDNEYNRKIVRQLVSRTTYRLIEAVDGESGVVQAQMELPDLVLMDVQLPKMSALDATRILKADPRTSHIPIIVITSFALS